jgi:ribose/xylose/arabinose/galactoside ABC-type transport system permease subunit
MFVRPETGAFGALCVLCLALSILSEHFFTVQNILNIIRQISIIGIIAVGMTFAIILSGIDLSVGSVFAFTGCVMATFMLKGVNPWLAALLGLFIGMAVGCVTGLLVVYLNLPYFIASLGMMSIFRGLALTITDGWPISLYSISKSHPALFQLGQGKVGGVPIQALCMLSVMVVFSFVLARTRFGSSVYAVGGNERAALLSGINVSRCKIAVFGLSGLLTAFAAILGITYVSAVEPMIGVGYELDAIAAAAIGGASMAGGSGSILGTFLGSCIMGVLYNGLVLLGMSPFMQQTFIGLVVIIAVALGWRITHKK